MTRMCPTQTCSRQPQTMPSQCLNIAFRSPHEQGAAGKCSRAKVLPNHVVCRLQVHTKTLTVFRIQTKRISRRRNVGTEPAVLQAQSPWKYGNAPASMFARIALPETSLLTPCRASTPRAGECSLFGLSGRTCCKLLFRCGRPLVRVHPQRPSACWRSQPLASLAATSPIS